ncbi:MAG: T9SS type A sorting domain-containing protein [Fibrobacterota bacterium]
MKLFSVFLILMLAAALWPANDDYLNPANYPNATVCDTSGLGQFVACYRGDAPYLVGLTPQDPSNPERHLSPIIDGMLEDSIWYYSEILGVQNFMNMDNANYSYTCPDTSYHGPADLQAIWRFIYNEEALFIGIEIHDDTTVIDSIGGWYMQDGVGFGIDPSDWNDYGNGLWTSTQNTFRRYLATDSSIITYPNNTQNDFLFFQKRLNEEPYFTGLVRGIKRMHYDRGDEGLNFTRGVDSYGISFAARPQGTDRWGRSIWHIEIKVPFRPYLFAELETNGFFNSKGLPKPGNRFKMCFQNYDVDAAQLDTNKNVTMFTSARGTNFHEESGAHDSWFDTKYYPSFMYTNTTVVGFHPIIGSGSTIVEETQVSHGNVAGVSVSPNPFNPSTVITLSGSKKPANISIYSISGARVANFKNVTANSIRWNAASLPSGVYFVKAILNNKVHTAKILLQK